MPKGCRRLEREGENPAWFQRIAFSGGSAEVQLVLMDLGALCAGSSLVSRLLQSGSQRASGRSALYAEKVRYQAQGRQAGCRPAPALPVHRGPPLYPRPACDNEKRVTH